MAFGFCHNADGARLDAPLASPAFTGTAIATDNCDSDPIITFDDIGDDGDCESMMIITRTWTVTDACGNTNSCIQTISLLDSTTTGVYSDLARINQENSVKIYPNPFENSINVECLRRNTVIDSMAGINTRRF